MSRRCRSLTGAGLVLASLMVLLPVACTEEAPLVSEETRSNNATIDEVRAWVAQEFDLAISASGNDGGWHWRTASVELPWQRSGKNREDILHSLAPMACSSDGGHARIGTSLINRDASEDDIATAIRETWEHAGWMVSDVYPDGAGRELYFIAEREDGAMLSFQRVPEQMILRAYSACSSHTSVTRWGSDTGTS